MMLSHDVQKVNSSIISKGAMNNFKETFPLARMFPLAVMHRGAVPIGHSLQFIN